jgi:hypothetical protein
MVPMYPFPLYHGTKRKFRKTTVFFTGAYPKNDYKPSCFGRLNLFPKKGTNVKRLKNPHFKTPYQKSPARTGQRQTFFILNTHP